MVIERSRQFYAVARAFRVVGPNGTDARFVDFSNAGLAPQPVGMDSMGQTLFRQPVFDLKIKAQKRNPFSRMEQNQRALELYSAGFFAPENAQAAMGALNMMDVEGKEDVRDYVAQGQTLLNVVQQLTQQVQMLAAQMSARVGVDMAAQNAQDGQNRQGGVKGQTVDEKASQSQESNLTGYQQKLAARSVPDMNSGSHA